MRIATAAALTAAFIGLACADAEAQGRFQSRPLLPRGFISANGIFQATATTFTDAFEFREFVEDGTIEASFEAKPAIALDGAFGVRVWGKVGFGGGISTYAPKKGGTFTARIPHPLEFNKHREVSGDAGLSRKETAIHGSILYFIPVGEKVLAVIGAGPTYFQADQSFVNRVLYSQEYPFDAVTLHGVDIDSESASGLGFNASVDLSWRFSKSFGVGGIVRYTRATLPFTPGDTERQRRIDVGGVQAGLGLRVTF